MAAGSSPAADPTSGRDPYLCRGPSRCSRTGADADVCSRRAHHVRARRPLRRTPPGALAARRGARRPRRPPRPGRSRSSDAAGIGKTRLLAELAARADARGHIVLGGAGADLERDLPFWVFVDALDEYLAERRAETAGEPRRRRARRARAGLPVVVGPRPRRCRRESCTSATGPTGRSASCSNGWRPPSRWCSSSTTSTGPTPRPSISRPACCTVLPAAGVLIVLASRPNHASPRLRSATEQALRAGQLTRIELEPLTGEEAAAMLGREPSDAEAALLYEESGGNPFYLEQLARASDGAARVALGSEAVGGRAAGAGDGRGRAGRGARAAVGRQPAGVAGRVGRRRPVRARAGRRRVRRR